MQTDRISFRPYLLAGLLCVAAGLSAQDADPPKAAQRVGSAKRFSFADEAVGVQTKGQIQNLTMNYGQISDTRFADVGNAPTDIFYDIRYPRQNFTGLVDDFSIFFAVKENTKNGDKGNVIDAWTDDKNEDFMAKDGAYGLTHYNAALDPNPHAEVKYNGQTPYLATSDLPGGVVNLLTGKRAELAPHIAGHLDVNAIVDGADDAELSATLRTGTAVNLKRYTKRSLAAADWFKAKAEDPYWILDTIEFKTAWHPIGL